MFSVLTHESRNQLDRREPIVHIHISNQVKNVFKKIGEGIKNIGLKVLGSLPTPLAIPARIASTAISIAEGVKKIKKAVSAEHKIKDAAKAANHANDAKNAVHPHHWRSFYLKSVGIEELDTDVL